MNGIYIASLQTFILWYINAGV